MSNTPKDWWSNPDNGKDWEDQVIRSKKSGNLGYIEQPNIVISAFKKSKRRFKSILEVGCGTGHIIGSLKKEFPKRKCFALDINSKLLSITKRDYRKLDGFFEADIADASTLKDIKSSSFDIVYTYQVLQHIPPDEIVEALANLIRITKRELWLFEGYKEFLDSGARTHGSHNGSYSWKLDKMIECYEISIPKSNKIECTGQRLYKIKK